MTDGRNPIFRRGDVTPRAKISPFLVNKVTNINFQSWVGWGYKKGVWGDVTSRGLYSSVVAVLESLCGAGEIQ